MSSALGLSFALLLCGAAAPAGAPSDAGSSTPRAVLVLPVEDLGHDASAELAAAAHALRVALREHGAVVLTPAELRTRLGAAESRVAELERAYAGAQAAYQADELESAARILESVLSDIEELPESAGARDLWVRAQLRRAQVERARDRSDEAAAIMERILALDPALVVDPDQFAPSFRRAFEEARARAQLSRKATLTVGVRGAAAIVYVDGREVGRAPVALALPAGRYRVRGAIPGAAGTAPLTAAVVVTLSEQPLAIEVDAALAEAVRLSPGTSIAAPAAERGAVATKVGRWVHVDEFVAIEAAGGERPGISATLYDVRRGALIREVTAPLVGGTLRPESVSAIASYLLTGERSMARIDLTAAHDPAPEPARWLRPGAWVAGVSALALGAVSLLEARAAHDAASAAAAMVRPDGVLVPGADRAGYDGSVQAADRATRAAWIAGGGAVAVAITAALLGYRSLDVGSGAVLVPAVRF